MFFYKFNHSVNKENSSYSWMCQSFAHSQDAIPKTARSHWRPPMDITESSHHFLIEAEIPGINPECVEVEVGLDYLTIRGEKKSPHSLSVKSKNLLEREYGTFESTVRLPIQIEVEAVKPGYTDGVLTIQTPKMEASHFREIPIQFTSKQPRSLKIN